MLVDFQEDIRIGAFSVGWSHTRECVLANAAMSGAKRVDPGEFWRGDKRMLVLSRKLGEKIWIGNNVCITVVDIDRGKIRLGISAPRDIPVHREELLTCDEIERNQNGQPVDPTSLGGGSAG